MLRSIMLGCLFLISINLFSQSLFQVEGNGLFSSAASTNVDIQNTDDNTNALIRFGDNSTSKASVGFNGNEDVFKVSMATTLGREDLTISESGLLGINALPDVHRMLILHNSTSGTSGSAHLTLRENNTGDFARLRFENEGDDGLWVIASRATDGDARMNFFHNDGSNFDNILSLDGDNFRTGILTTAPEGSLHIKQKNAGTPALVLENDDASGSDKWAFEVGDANLEIFYEGAPLGHFDAITGEYMSDVPPPPSIAEAMPMKRSLMAELMKLEVKQYEHPRTTEKMLGLDPNAVQLILPELTSVSRHGISIRHEQLCALVIRGFQEQQLAIDEQDLAMEKLLKQQQELRERMEVLTKAMDLKK